MIYCKKPVPTFLHHALGPHSGKQTAHRAAMAEKLKGWRLLRMALASRKAGIMLALGFSSGLPFALLIGTINAWLGEAHISMAAIGVFAWIGLAYSFKFLWSPLVDRCTLPVFGVLGWRKGWILFCQVVLVAAIIGLALTDPVTALGRFALIALVAALASATQDVAIDAWRIDIADEVLTVELLSSLFQLGYRLASLVGGAFALFLAARLPWPTVFEIMAGLIGLVAMVTLAAPDTPRLVAGGAEAMADQPAPMLRAGALAVVALGWGWAIGSIALFMIEMLGPITPGVVRPSATDFTRGHAPLIVLATVGLPLLVAALTNRARTGEGGPSRIPVADHLWLALVAPLSELLSRLGWRVLVMIGLILTYPLCYNLWASFAYPFYLNFLHYTKDEVAFASKIFGIFMTMAGIATGGVLFARLGRMPTILIGATLPILGNFIYADLAEGAQHIDAVARAIGLVTLGDGLGVDVRMMRLLIVIGVENVSVGIAGAAFVAFISGQVSRKHAAVQYALLSSMTLLIGSLGKGIAGDTIDHLGYPTMFRWTAVAGVVAVGFVLLEWVTAAKIPPPGRGGS
jgi:PAT family beta-lactamase induction signal transducer AmpG